MIDRDIVTPEEWLDVVHDVRKHIRTNLTGLELTVTEDGTAWTTPDLGPSGWDPRAPRQASCPEPSTPCPVPGAEFGGHLDGVDYWIAGGAR